jgi:rare lipoprotein A (peptidoglycan hydrolase)
MGRIARPPADDQEASVYWEDKWDARGKRFKANEVSCAHRTEAFGTMFVVTNLENGKKIRTLPGSRLLARRRAPDRL